MIRVLGAIASLQKAMQSMMRGDGHESLIRARDFVVSAARDAAQRVIAQVEVIRFGKDASVAFAELLTEPGGPRIKLAEATPVHNDLFGAP